ncbi:MAG TPA: sialate O-acetylesterase [Candidatus Paceibacterota bacterium]|nr:sialate O-acetylesterase [Candidatus Paceibacterota bacterium]
MQKIFALTNMSRLMLCVTVGLIGSTRIQAEVRLPRIFGHHMVLQQDKPLVFWGWSDPNETITLSFGSENTQVKANDRGEWKVALPARKAGGPWTLKFSGSSTVQFEDVLVGEVWLASGQSNMEMGIGACQNGQAEIATANHPQIRLFLVANRWTPEPQVDLEGGKDSAPKPEGAWKVCSPQAVAEGGWGGFSAGAYYFGRELHRQLRVPVGLIDATWGGTRIESWTPPEGFAAVPALQKEFERVQLADPRTLLYQQRLQQVLGKTEQWLTAAREALSRQTVAPPMPTYPPELLPPSDVQHATALYNGMIRPLHPFPLRGAIWYQGESNSGEGRLYTERMKALIRGWRGVWNDPQLAFYYVQIAPFDYGGNGERIGEFWEAQADAQSIPNTGMVVINDIGNLKDIHPANKQDVGRRLAAWALAKQYGKSNEVYSGPTFQSMKIEGNELRVTFDHVAGGLASRDGKALNWFEIIDADEGGFVRANARIEGASVVLSSPEVKRPVAMRFAWHMLAEPNLMNSAGLPAGAFRAGQVPNRDLLDLKVPEAKHYQVVLDLDLAKLGPTISYTEDHRAKNALNFNRIAYFLELQTSDGNTQYLYVSMDAFTDSADKIGIPTAASGGHFQQNVANLNVYSNVRGIVTGTNMSGGNIEFWSGNYATENSANVPNASGQVYDFGDQPADPADGYGSMQVHNHAARQTLFAINHWREGSKADIGIGNQSTGNGDWTFASNANQWTAKRLRVLVRGTAQTVR